MLTPTDPDHAGFTEHNRPDALGMNPLITAAGPMAEARYRFGQLPTQREVRSVIDRNGHDYSTLDAAGNPSPTEAAPLLDRCWPDVVELAAVLYDHGEVFEGDVIRALRIPPCEAGARYLTDLRSGYRAVS